MPELLDRVVQIRNDAERAFAGIAFLRSAELREQCGWLDAKAIRDERLREWWEAVIAGKDGGEAAIDIGLDFLAQITKEAERDEYAFNFNLNGYAEKVAQGAWFYALAANMTPLANHIANGNAVEVQRMLSEMQAELPKGAIGIPTTTDIGLEFVSSLSETNRTIFTGTPIDKATGGLWRSTLSIICARPGVGKTALGFQIGRCVAISGKKVLFISLEMSRRALWARAACGMARIPYRDVLARRISETQEQAIINANNELLENYGDRLWIDDKILTTKELWRNVSSIKPDIVICDHLRLFSDKNESEVRRLGQITWALKQMAKEFDIHVLALAQLNRNLEGRVDKHPTLADLRDSGEIEENADFVFGLHRDRTCVEKPQERTPADLEILKFRDGPSNVLIRLLFDGLGQWFEAAH